MEKEKPKKEAKPKVPKKTEPKIKMVSYSIKMVIPTGAYANIQPEIIVQGGTMEEAHAYIAPHMNKLWKEYYMISERVAESKAETKATDAPATNHVSQTPPPPASSVAFNKASQAIASCLTMDALKLISDQIQKSVKLTKEDKVALMPVWENKFNELNGKQTATS